MGIHSVWARLGGWVIEHHLAFTNMSGRYRIYIHSMSERVRQILNGYSLSVGKGQADGILNVT